MPHPVRGTVSLVEWHMARSRNHINQLEENMTLLMEQASTNESLFYRLLHLQARLASAHSLDEFLSRFHRWARELGLAGATIRLFLTAGALAHRPGLPIWRSVVRRLNRCAFSVWAMRITIWGR